MAKPRYRLPLYSTSVYLPSVGRKDSRQGHFTPATDAEEADLLAAGAVPVDFPVSADATGTALVLAGNRALLNRTPQGVNGYPVLTNRNNVAAGLATTNTIPQTAGGVFFFPNGAGEVRVCFQMAIISSGGLENTATADAVYTAAVEIPKGNTPIQFTFNNGTTTSGTAAFATGNVLISDPVPADILPGGSAFFTWFANGTALPGNLTTATSGGDMLGGKITGATNATPVVLTTFKPHTFTTGAPIKVAQVSGNTGANGTFTVGAVTANTITLTGSTGTGAYTSGGYYLGDDLTAVGSAGMLVSGGQVIPAPFAIVGSPTGGSRASAAVGLLGDSIMNGTGDSVGNAGPFARAFGGPYGCTLPYIQGSRGGTKGVDFADLLNVNSKSIRRRRAMLNMPYVIWEFAVNDLFNGTTAVQLQAAMLSVGFQVFNRGGRFAVTTCTPNTTDSTGTAHFVGIADQVQRTGEDQRQIYNSWLRDGAPVDATTLVAVAAGTATNVLRIGSSQHPIWKMYDWTATVEVNSQNVPTLNGGYWWTDGVTNNSGTIDGTHPSPASVTRLQGAIPASDFVAYA